MHRSESWRLVAVVGLWLLGLSAWAQAETGVQGTDAERSLSQYQASIFQVKIIDAQSHSQSAIGTGFFIDDGSLLATNYHVVASVVLEPEQYSAVVEVAGDSVTMEVVALDVIHDLAILRVPVQGPPLRLSQAPPPRGARLYSIGNPLNIGMTLVEGNYNGLVDDRFFDQIHFSGAINAGMSGGPTLNGRGEVVGINAASAGNQVGFLVPADKLRQLVRMARAAADIESEAATETVPKRRAPAGQLPATELQREIFRQLQQATHTMIDQMLARPWPREALGDAMVIGQVHQAVDCWGDSDEDTEKRLTQVRKGCNSRDGIYISHHLRSGFFEYEFSYQKAHDWPPASLYRHITEMLGQFRPGNLAGKKHVDNYQCVDQVVRRDSDGLKRQVAYCTRPYLRQPELFDTLYVAATLDRPDTVLIEHFTLSGVSRPDAERFLARFVEQVAWQ